MDDQSKGSRGAFNNTSGLSASLREAFQWAGVHPAVVDADAGLSYIELAERSGRLALRLREAGVQAGDLLPLVLPRSIDMVVAMVAAVRVGATYVPVDPAAPPVRTRAILAALEVRVGVADDAALRSGLPGSTVWLSPHLPGPHQGGALPWHEGAWTDALYVMFTSGSTGAPKGVVVPARGLPPLIEAAVGSFPMGTARWSQASSPAFDISNLEIWGALLSGGCCVVQAQPHPSLDDLANFFSQHGITHGQLTPGLFNAMVEDYLPAFAGLRQMIIGGDRASPAHVRQFLLAHPHVRFINGYGPTETTIYSLFHEVALHDTDQANGVPIGRPLRGTLCKVVPQAGSELVGEMWIAGDGVALGYLGQAELTAERFVVDGAQRWYRSGDLVSQRSDGVFESHGRADRQVKVQGVRIELDEVELALAAFPGIDQVSASRRGEAAESCFLVAWYTAKTGAVDETVLRRFLAQRLPAAAIPRHLLWRRQMPVNVNGKVDRAQLERSYDEAPTPLAPQTFSTALRLMLDQARDVVALEGAGSALTYAELAAQSARVAGHLRELGVGHGDTVALLLPRSVALVVAMVAVLRCGAVYAPLQPGASAHRDVMLSALEPKLCIVSRPGQLDVPGIASVTMAELLVPDSGSDAPVWNERDATATACILFTSGSTGVPKGVCVPQAGLLRLVHDANHAAFGPGQRWAFLSSPAFDASHLEVWGPLLNGGTCVVCEDEDPSLDDIADFLTQRHITDAWLTSSLFNAMVDTQLLALRGLSQLLVGGERLSRRHVSTFLEQAPQVALINGYGPTENTTFTTCHRVGAADLSEPTGIPIGRALRGTALHIEATGADAAEGELWVAGDGVANGYLHDQASTAERFVVRDGRRWYRTGDIVRQRADGVLLYLGRADRQVKLQGHRIELEAVERTLAACPGVREAIVTVRGEEAHARHLVAAYTHDAAALPPEQVKAWLRQYLPDPAVPPVLLSLSVLPRTANGKVDREAVWQAHGTPMASPARACAEPLSLASPPLLERIAAIWQRYLPALQMEPLGDPLANFTQAGGTSVISLLVATAIRRELGARVSPVELLRRPLLQDHVDLVRAALPIGPMQAQPEALPGHGDPLLTEVQTSILSAALLDGSTPSMQLHIALCLTGGGLPAQWKAAFAAVVQRHPMLRLAAEHLGDRVVTRQLDQLPDGWWLQHGEMLDHFPADLAWEPRLLGQVQRPLQPETHGPMRVDLWPVAAGGYLLVWTVHHFAVDEIGIDNVLQEVNTLLQGRPLPPVYGSPFAFGAVERSWIDQSGVQARAQALARDLAAVPMPFDYRGQLSHEVPHVLPAALAAQLNAATKRWQSTPFAALLAAYGLALQEVFGPGVRHVLTPFSRRCEPQLLEPVTYFLDVRFIEAGSCTGEPAAAHLQRVQLQALQAHQPAFQPLPRVVSATAALSPYAAQWAGMFGFTWRHAPVRALRFGDAHARLIRVPQRGARFGVALHAAVVEDGNFLFSVEAIDQAHRDGWVARVWDAFCRHLQQVCAIDQSLEPEAAALPSSMAGRAAQLGEGGVGASAPGCHPSQAVTPAHAGVHKNSEPLLTDPAAGRRTGHDPLHTMLARAWRRWAPLTKETPDRHAMPDDEANFLASGGSSLAAMRLAAQVKREIGVGIDLSTFLRRPTFGELRNQLDAVMAAPPAEPPLDAASTIADLVWVGDPAAPRVVLVVPGDGGHAVGLLQVATELQRALGPEVAMGLIELANIVERSSTTDVGERVTSRVSEIAGLVGTQRLVALVGYSLGGLIALHTAHTLQLPGDVGVSLLDTYAPLRRAGTPLRAVEGKLARLVMFLRGWRAESFRAAHEHQAAVNAQDSRGSELWKSLHRQLHAHRRFRAPRTTVLLIQAEHSQFSTGLLWRRATNGLRPKDYRRLTVYRVPIGHLDLPKQSACAVAHLIAAQIRLLSR